MSKVIDTTSRPTRKKQVELQTGYGNIESHVRCVNILKAGHYRISPPAVKPSKLASKEKGGVGKDLSEGWGINFSIGCTHGCIFCYADQIHRKRLGNLISGISWGQYFFVPENFDEVLIKTPWERWKGKEVLMSAMHDPYLPQLSGYARKILETALPQGVRFCIQTRSLHVLEDIDILEVYKDQIRVQVSIATFAHQFYKTIEPRVVSPECRLKIIEEVKKRDIETGVIIAPIFPPNKLRPDVLDDLNKVFEKLSEIQPDRVFGETLHIRGRNLIFIESVLGKTFSKVELHKFDNEVGRNFKELLSKYNIKGEWWPEYKNR